MFLVKILEHVHVQTPSSQGFQSARKQHTALETTASLVQGGEGVRAVYTCMYKECVSMCASGRCKCKCEWSVQAPTEHTRGERHSLHAGVGGAGEGTSSDGSGQHQTRSREMVMASSLRHKEAPGLSYSGVCHRTSFGCRPC